TAAPAIPPTSACDDEVGNPRYHVMMSHTIAPMWPAKITPFVSRSWTTTSFAMVLATAVPKMRNAAKLKNAAQATANRGLRTRVDTTVAIEFAASWNPLKKSKARATAMMATTVMFMRLQAYLSTTDS